MVYPPRRATSSVRNDAHNTSVDFALASAGRCGMIHLQTGRVCGRPARHAGSCAFGPRDDVGAGGSLLDPEHDAGRGGALQASPNRCRRRSAPGRRSAHGATRVP
jgi:hypothetical protein